MRKRIFICQDCATTEVAPFTTGRPKLYCVDCTKRRKSEKAKADRAAVRVNFDVCQRPGCDNPIPPGSRADRKWCGKACQTWISRRTTGQVEENARTCPSCLVPLAGKYANAEQCGAPRCRGWLRCNPGRPHPSTQPRACKQCGASIDHLNGKAKFCCKPCRSIWLREQDREGHNAKARVWQSSPEGKAYRQAYQQANTERRNQWAREDRLRNPERYAKYWKQFAEANPAAVTENARRRRARQKGNPGSVGVSVRDWERMLARYRGCCAYCGVKADEIHMDHVVPIAKGGRHAIGNVVPACKKCNLAKHAMFLSAWRYRGRRWLLSA